ncbi:MAG: hypothetical protein OEM62_08355 [Acidobacteriota bacterium]|nr:hypothetical protein [Acidobacteriota bacterium]
MYRTTAICTVWLALLSAPAWSQELTTDGVSCLPNEANAAITAAIAPEISGSDEMRLYFRRLNPTGAFYWVEMNPTGAGSYWTVFPRPETREQRELTDEWWEILQSRDWMKGHDRQWLSDYFETQVHELAEYYVSTVDVNGRELARTPTLLVEVKDRDECRLGLDPFQVGQTRNLTVGEMTQAQHGHEVFHWLCDGIVSRVSFEGILREDEFCRACVVAGWLPVVPAGAALIAGTTIEKREPRRASEVQPGN